MAGADRMTIEEVVRKVLLETVLGSNHVSLASTLAELGAVEHQDGNAYAAREAHQHALAIREAALGPDDVEVGYTLFALARAERELRDYEAARRHLKRDLIIEEAALGPDP